MASKPVPVTLGSPRYSIASIDGCDVVHAWFPPGEVLHPHTHDRATVAIMMNGAFDLRFSRHEFSCTPATVSVEPAGERHANRMSPAGAEVLVLQPDLSRDDLWRPFRALLDAVGCRRHAGVAERARRLADEMEAPDPFTGIMTDALVLEMLVLAARGSLEVEGGGPPPWLLRAQEMLHDAPGTLRIADCAAEAGVHPAHLARAFRQHFRVSVGTYLRRLRLQLAADRLRATDTSIASIAHEAGFADQSHLTRLFKRHLGVTPQQHRLRYRASPTNATAISAAHCGATYPRSPSS